MAETENLYAAVLPVGAGRPGPAVGFATERCWSRQENGPFGAVNTDTKQVG